MNSKEEQKNSKKKKKSGQKRKKDSQNVSSNSDSQINTKVHVQGVNDAHINDTCSQTISTPVPCFMPSRTLDMAQNSTHNQSTPLNLNFVPPNMSYGVSPVGAYPVHSQSYSQGYSQFDNISYGEKMDVLCTKLDSVFKKLEKLDIIEQRLQNFETSINTVTKDVKVLKDQMKDIDTSLNFINDKFEENIQRVDEITLSVEEMKAENASLREEINGLNEKHVDLQARSMRDNLIFTGFQELEEENTEELLKDFIVKDLEIGKNIEFHRVHRMGRKFQTGRPRPIVAKFVNFKDREMIRKSAPEKLKALNNHKYGVNEQFPKEINDRRKALYPHLKSAKRNNKRANLVYDKLYIDGRLFIPDTRETQQNETPRRTTQNNVGAYHGSKQRAKGNNSRNNRD